MESFSGDGEGSASCLTGRSKSKLETLKTRRFGKTKTETQLSQSASDITRAEDFGSVDNLCSGTWGSRALSLDSIFLVDQEASSPEQPRDLSKENVQGRIKELQMKLQQQNMHLGPPPTVLPIKRPEDLGSSSENDGMSMDDKTRPRGTSYKDSSKPMSCSLSAVPLVVSSVPLAPSVPVSALSSAPPALDFSTPAQLNSCLDNSAARHRMSIKPRNQRACAKSKQLTTTESRPRSESLNFYLAGSDERNKAAITGRTRSHSNHILKTQQGGLTMPTAPPEPTPLMSGPAEASKCPKTAIEDLHLLGKTSPKELSYSGVPNASPAPVTAKLPATKARANQTPHFDTPDLKTSLGDLETPAPPPNTRDTLSRSVMPDPIQSTESLSVVNPAADTRPTSSLASVVFLKTSSPMRKPEAQAVCQSTTAPPAGQEDPGQTAPLSPEASLRSGSGSFRFSVTTASWGGRTRTGSGGFLGVVQQVEAKKQGRREGAEVNMGHEPWRNCQEAAGSKEEVVTAAGVAEKVLEGEEVEERVEEAVEAKEETQEEEENGKTAFGVKLRSTFLSLRVRAEAAAGLKSNWHHADVDYFPPAPSSPASSPASSPVSKPTGLEGPGDSLLTRFSSMINMDTSGSTTSSNGGSVGCLREADPGSAAQPTTSPSPKEVQTSPAVPNKVRTSPVAPVETQLASQDVPTGPQEVPRAAVSWMSRAWVKTRDLQQLLTNSLPREFPGMPTASQTQATTTTTAPALAQIVEQTQRQKFSLRATQHALHSTTHAPAALRSAPQLATSTEPARSSSPRSTPSQPPWSAQDIDPTPQPEPGPKTTLATVQGQKSPVLQGRCNLGTAAAAKVGLERPGTVGERTAFLEKQTERSPSPGSKMDLRRTRITSVSRSGAESVASPKTTPTHVAVEVAKHDRRPESSPTKVPGRLADREDKWSRKNVPSSSSPSSSPSTSSPLQAVTDAGGQPSWMELAKRKSLAWNDKTMD
ncbi:hypothetical protein DPEC_G00051740 [Dallia pectoralis]|uniref:Uncharacterized protein n=1 Tax=Dallia pectoralis TaxID=75939 RepID=A0ACC2HBK5_DALPE|nr:hypothetical protein DPEC_G00051740 [Dallia pectoralis]